MATRSKKQRLAAARAATRPSGKPRIPPGAGPEQRAAAARIQADQLLEVLEDIVRDVRDRSVISVAMTGDGVCAQLKEVRRDFDQLANSATPTRDKLAEYTRLVALLTQLASTIEQWM